tara:strand:- start:1020 stop:1358 length:339 start_codon:yes stop_codon:yes gene_type:complete
MTHTVPTQDLIEITHQSNEHLDNLYSLIEENFKDVKDLKFCYPFTLICELVWINNTILLTLRRDMQDLSFKDNTQKELIISRKTMEVLMTLLVARLAATTELNNLGYSLSAN